MIQIGKSLGEDFLIQFLELPDSPSKDRLSERLFKAKEFVVELEGHFQKCLKNEDFYKTFQETYKILITEFLNSG